MTNSVFAIRLYLKPPYPASEAILSMNGSFFIQKVLYPTMFFPSNSKPAFESRVDPDQLVSDEAS